MIATVESGFTVADLERALKQVDPAVVLAPPRILRRVIKKDRGLTGLGLQVPHRKSYLLTREALLTIASRDELGLPADRSLPDALLLMPRPDAMRLTPQKRPAILLKYWRLLFHAHIHKALAELFRKGQLTEPILRQRIQELGSIEFSEARAVLRQENFLLPPYDLAITYEEFAALFLELRFFAPHMVARFFPAIANPEAVEDLLGQEIDARGIFQRTRLEGAPGPTPTAIDHGHGAHPPVEEGVPQVHSAPTAALRSRLLARADQVGRKGNQVRAAILRYQAFDWSVAGERAAAQAGAFTEIEGLTARLRKALGFSEAETRAWNHCLQALLEPAARGVWSVEARLLYDLQKVCVDEERDIFALDLVEWIVSWGRRPIKRLLPNHRQVLMVKHLRSALHRLSAARIPDNTRISLEALLRAALHHAEDSLRERLRPALLEALTEVQLVPGNLPEQVSREKLIEELLDRVVERGFLTMSDLRDALARNQLKLPDLRGPDEFILGDQLIRANRECAARVDGVYRRGEIYLRWLQRFSAAAFGTRTGRFLTRYLALPFGGAFVVLKGLVEIVELGCKPLGHFFDCEELGHHLNEMVPVVFPFLGLFFLALYCSSTFRAVVGQGLTQVWRGVRGLLYDLPFYVFHLPWVRRILQSKIYLTLFLYFIKPMSLSLPVGLALYLSGAGPGMALLATLILYAVISAILNSRLGIYLEEVSADGLVRTWQLLRADLLPGLFRLVMFLFKRLIEDVERLLYTVDELLRFRTGDSRFSIYWKPVVGLLWFFITYAIRVIINLFVEPTINPIKHFPVVTVAAKLLLPFILEITRFFQTPMEPFLGHRLAGMVAWSIFVLLPGLAGFMVWEFKENWKLYRANRSPRLRAEVIGSHGETMLRFLRPGLHSGTLPKIYAKLRRKRGTRLHKQYEAMHHVQEGLRHFLERELLAFLSVSASWGKTTPLYVGAIQTGTNRIRFQLYCPGSGGGDSIYLDFEEQAGFLLAGLGRQGPQPAASWLDRLTPEQLATWKDALAALYLKAGVDLVHEQIAATLPPGSRHVLTELGLNVWPAAGYEAGGRYDLSAPGDLVPQPIPASATISLPTLRPDQLLFNRVVITWNDWVEAWRRDLDGKGHQPLLTPDVTLVAGK
jgi:hypothetical protein